jgi:hypothetical protein
MSVLDPIPLRRRRWWGWREWLLLLGALVLIVLLRKGQPDYDARVAPLLVHGHGLDRVEGRNFAIDVKGFKVAGAYLVAGDFSHPQPRQLKSSGVWLSVVGTLEALEKPGIISARLQTRDGLFYDTSGSGRPKLDGVNLTDRFVAPGLPESGAYFFELPPDKLQGAHLQVYWGNLTPGLMDSLVDIDLGIDAARARALLDEAEPVLDLRK